MLLHALGLRVGGASEPAALAAAATRSLLVSAAAYAGALVREV